MKTYQDFLQAQGNKAAFISQAIQEYRGTIEFKIARDAELYDQCKNPTIRLFQKFLYNTAGHKYPDVYAANNKIASNLFSQLVTQEAEYSLANGVEFEDKAIVEKLGRGFDGSVERAGRSALLMGKSYTYCDGQKNTTVFKATEFCPLYDEYTGALMAGIRFYKVDRDKPLNAWLYETDGYTYYRSKDDSETLFEYEPKKNYKDIVVHTNADGDMIVGHEDFPALPIVELYGNPYGASELVFIRDKIDAYDLTLSGLANDIDENAFVYWIISNAGGMEDSDLARFKQALRTAHTAVVDSDDGTKAEHFQNDVPTEARTVMLDRLKADIYEAFGAFNPSTVAGGAVTATQILAAYTAADNKAALFETEVRKFIQKILYLYGIEVDGYTITFTRQKLQNELENAQIAQTKVTTLMALANEIDDETLLTALSKVVPELYDINVKQVLNKKDASLDFTVTQATTQEPTTEV